MQKIVRGAVGVVTAGVLVTGGAGSALAGTGGPSANWTGACSGITDVQNSKAWGYCEGGDGAMFRVWIECSVPILPWNTYRFGEWKEAGKNVSSYASCPGTYVDSGIDTFETRT